MNFSSFFFFFKINDRKIVFFSSIIGRKMYSGERRWRAFRLCDLWRIFSLFLLLLVNWNRKWHLGWTLFLNYKKVIMGKWRVWRRDNDVSQTLSKYITQTGNMKYLFIEFRFGFLTNVDSIKSAPRFCLRFIMILKMRCFNFRIQWKWEKKKKNLLPATTHLF